MHDNAQDVQTLFDLTFIKKIIETKAKEKLPPKEAFIHLFQEMKVHQLQQICKHNNINSSAAKKNAKEIYQLIHIKMNKSINKSKLYRNGKQLFLYSVFHALEDLYHQFPYINEPSDMLGKEHAIRSQFGDWHCYFALWFILTGIDAYQERLQELLEELLQHPERVDTPNSQVISQHQDQIMKLEALLQQERNGRIELQTQLDRYKRQYQMVDKHYQTLQLQLSDLEKSNAHLQHERNDLEKKIKDLTLSVIKKNRIEQHYENLVNKHEELLQQHKCLQQDHDALNEQFQAQESRLKELAVENDFLTRRYENMYFKYKVQQPSKNVSFLQDPSPFQFVYQSLYYSLLQNIYSQEDERSTLQLLESFESFCHQKQIQIFLSLQQQQERDKFLANISRLQQEEGETSDITPMTQQQEEVIDPDHIGQFSREAHGGKIELHSGNVIYVTETIVQSCGIEHQALVKAVPRTGRSEHRYFTVLMQGDDRQAPIKQGLGKIEYKGEQAYCIDVNTSEELIVHQKDQDILDLKEGQVCTYNRWKDATRHDYNIIRISKLHVETELKTFTPIAQTTKRKEAAASGEIEPFLTGCKIAIVGGLEKWFASTVKATGATLIHNTGETPHRIYTDLAKCDALFLLLTANSHTATYGCVEVAKKHDIPIYKIQGSKTGLLKMLYDHRLDILERHSRHEMTCII